MTEKSFPTVLTNATRKPLTVYELDGSVLVLLQPGQSFSVESRNPRTAYARWERCEWHANGHVSFVARTDWREPDRGRWVLHLLNQDGAEIEWRQVGEERVALPKGVPVIVTAPLKSDLVKFRSLTVIRKRILVKSDQHTGYCASRWILIDDRTPRPDSELKVLTKILDGLGKGK